MWSRRLLLVNGIAREPTTGTYGRYLVCRYLKNLDFSRPSSADWVAEALASWGTPVGSGYVDVSPIQGLSHVCLVPGFDLRIAFLV